MCLKVNVEHKWLSFVQQAKQVHTYSSLLVVCVSPGRSVVYQQNSKESATLQPFFTLQLDIQSEKIRTVQEALETLVARESVQGYTSKTKQEVWPQCIDSATLLPCVYSIAVGRRWLKT